MVKVGKVAVKVRSRAGCGGISGRSYTRHALRARRSATLPAAFAGLDRPDTWPPPRLRPRSEALERPLSSLAGVGPALTEKLAKLGLRTIRDLLEHRPHRYEQAVPERPIADLLAGEEAAIAGEVVRVSVRRPSRRLAIVQARVADGSDEITAVWFNQAWLVEKLRPGTRVRLRGQLKRNEFAVRSYDLNGVSATADFAPVYPASEEVPPKRLRALVERALPHVRDFPDALPAPLKVSERLPLHADALVALHQPRSEDEAERGRRRLAFDELLVLQVGLARARSGREAAVATGLGEPGDLTARYRALLPFALTKDQEQAIAEIDADLARTAPMQRLLQGDVGSGKTVVALYALLRAVEAGRRGALMAPTETLAEQHFLTIEPLCEQLGVRVALLTGSVKSDVEEARIVVGTHALIQEGVELEELALAVVDEQHRFGVEQRRALTEGRAPHVLHMTATPIPRTLALTVYGDLHVTEIAKPPASRKPIVTSWVTAERSSEAYTRLRKHLDAGRQAYVVCPLIEESETSQARAAEGEAERLRRVELKGYRVGLLHGRLRPAERRELMGRFKAGELDVLVATTVIEVGVDVPNATIMIVQEADRFGLAQLHQLRGRVGRGGEQSYCLLISRQREELTDNAQERLQALVDSGDGFELAEKDLELRGEGQLMGTRQAGLSEFRFTRLRADRPLLERARAAAEGLVDYEGPLADEVKRMFGERDLAA
ncbi:MAG TPA: ATP-dependent DNA helicase RecG [Gaiellaceae bacterium]|nr:ATP-dependent DNA helicase RecG [Gaiellaceae bacterium]